MFEIVPEPEFSYWFEALLPSEAESVAAALEVVATAGKVLSPTRLSRSLLWFDACAGESSGVDIWATAAAAQQLREHLEWHQQAQRVLQSSVFLSRLQAAVPECAAEALRLVERIKHQLRAASVRAMMTFHVPQNPVHPDSKTMLEESFMRLLGMIGMKPERIANTDSGLRELTITTLSPGLRILFGLDAERSRLVAILGEQLNRCYYGDSVRLAEARWAAYAERAAVISL